MEKQSSERDRGRWGSFGVYYDMEGYCSPWPGCMHEHEHRCHDSAFAHCIKDDVMWRWNYEGNGKGEG